MRIPDKFKAELCFALAVPAGVYAIIVLAAHIASNGWW